MRLPADKVKEAILHADQDVREAAVYYFARSHSSDPTVMPLVIQAIEKFGFDNAFQTHSFMEDLVEPVAQDGFELLRAFWQASKIEALVQPHVSDSYYTELDQDYDRVLDIFVRANEGGTKLSKSDLLLSMVTSKWSGVNAREQIYGFVERINNDLTRKNDFDKDFVMKTCLVVTDLPVQYKVDNFNNQNLALIQNKWDSIKKSIETAVNLVNWYGIDRDTLTMPML